MSYIAELPSVEGLVLVADTQETVREEKQHSEKLAVSDDPSYPLALGGPGVDEFTDAFSQELPESVLEKRPRNAGELKSAAQEAIGAAAWTEVKRSAWRKSEPET